MESDGGFLEEAGGGVQDSTRTTQKVWETGNIQSVPYHILHIFSETQQSICRFFHLHHALKLLGADKLLIPLLWWPLPILNDPAHLVSQLS